MESLIKIYDYITEKHMKAGEYTDLSRYDDIPAELKCKSLICSEIDVGGSHVSESEPERYENDSNHDEIRLLPLILKELTPDITREEQLQIYDLVKSSKYTNYDDYHGNTYDYQINYIKIEDFISCIQELNLFDVACKNINKENIKPKKNKIRPR